MVTGPECTLREREDYGFEVLSVVLLEIQVFCDVMVCGHCFSGQYFEGSTIFRNAGKYSPNDTVALVRKSDSSRGKFLLLPRKKNPVSRSSKPYPSHFLMSGLSFLAEVLNH